MNIIYLAKKDLLLGKKYVLGMMLFIVGFLMLASWQAPMMNGFILFLYSAVFTELMICQSISMAETKYPKASAFALRRSLFPR